MNLQFNWFCKRKNEDFGVDMANIYTIPTLPAVTMPGQRAEATKNKTLPRDGFIGCFGTGIGKLNDEGRKC